MSGNSDRVFVSAEAVPAGRRAKWSVWFVASLKAGPARGGGRSLGVRLATGMRRQRSSGVRAGREAHHPPCGGGGMIRRLARVVGWGAMPAFAGYRFPRAGEHALQSVEEVARASCPCVPRPSRPWELLFSGQFHGQALGAPEGMPVVPAYRQAGTWARRPCHGHERLRFRRDAHPPVGHGSIVRTFAGEFCAGWRGSRRGRAGYSRVLARYCWCGRGAKRRGRGFRNAAAEEPEVPDERS